MVRLKGYNMSFYDFMFVIFQFLMVRLKGADKKSNFANRVCISIPYGAIKSDHCNDEETVKKIISIPYGAIKS